MTETTRPRQNPPFPAREQSQQAPRETTQPWDYQRHLEAEHNLRVDSQEGWPTAVRRFRLFRPLEGKKAEKTLVSFTGREPEALDHFFHYIHPTPRVSQIVRQPAWRR